MDSTLDMILFMNVDTLIQPQGDCMDDEKLKIIWVDIEDAFLSHQATNEEIYCLRMYENYCTPPTRKYQR